MPMLRKVIRLVLITASCLALPICWSCFSAVAEVPDPVFVKYKSFLEQLDLNKVTAFGAGVASRDVIDPPTPQTRKQFLIARNGDKSLFWEQGINDSDDKSKPPPGERYRFYKDHIFYQVDSSVPGGPYYASNIGPIQKGQRGTLDFYTKDLLCAPYRLFSQPILSLINDSNFAVLKIEQAVPPRNHQWKFFFKYKFATRSVKNEASGSFTVDPENSWSVTSFESVVLNQQEADPKEAAMMNSRTRTDILYGSPIAGKPLLDQVKTRVESKFIDGRPYIVEHEYKFNDFQWRAYSPEAFTLAHYGLGDLEPDTRNDFVRNVLSLFAGILMVSGMYVVIWKAKRKVIA